MTTPPPNAHAGWYPDPDGGALRRYWDGSDWGPFEPQGSSPEGEAAAETPEPATVAQALRQVKREVKKEWAKAEEDAEAAAEAASIKVNFWAAGIGWLFFTIVTWTNDF